MLLLSQVFVGFVGSSGRWLIHSLGLVQAGLGPGESCRASSPKAVVEKRSEARRARERKPAAGQKSVPAAATLGRDRREGHTSPEVTTSSLPLPRPLQHWLTKYLAHPLQPPLGEIRVDCGLLNYHALPGQGYQSLNHSVTDVG